MKVDLHMHTACSDGVYPPEQLVEMACRAGLETIAITDHDTVAAYEKGSSFSKSLRVIPGIEISSEYEVQLINPITGDILQSSGKHLASSGLLIYSEPFTLDKKKNR